MGVKKGLIKGEALRLLRTNSSGKSFYENISNFKTRLRARGYSHNRIQKIISEVKFTERKSALQQTGKVRKKILPFVTRYHPALPNLKNILMSKWHLIPRGGGGYLTHFNTGRLRPEVQPLTLLYTILAKRYPFYISFIEERYPFHIPNLGSLVLIFM